MAQYHRAQVGRASAILTTSEVAGNTFKLERAQDSQVTVDLSFTVGSLTDVAVYCYASMDDSTYDLINVAGQDLEYTLTADTERCYTMPRLDGWKYFRVSLKGTGTATSSLAEFKYRYLARGSQS